MIQTIHQWRSNFVEDDVIVRASGVKDYTDQLTPEELEFIASSVSIRRQTYSTGRFCAKNALHAIGVDQRDYSDGLLRQEDGSVAWPEAVIGSISHTNDWAVAAVAKSGKNYLSLGVDIERIDRVEKDVLRLIATDEERVNLESDYELRWGRVALFSIKESLYKCLRPLYGEFIGFKDVQISNLDTPLTSVASVDSNVPFDSDGRSNQSAALPEFYSPTVQLLLPSLAKCCDAQRLHVRLAILSSHVLSIVTYHK